MNLSDYQAHFLQFLFGATNEPVLPNSEVYRFGVEVKAVRALEQGYPTVRALLGPADFEGLAFDYFRMIRKQTGDWSDFGWGFPSWIISHRISDRVPYLSDVARLDNQVARIERSHYEEVNVESFAAIEEDLASCSLILNKGLQFFRSMYPVVSIWEAHKSETPKDTLSFAQAKRMIAKGRGQNALIYRAGWKGMAEVIPETDLLLLEAVRNQRSIAEVFGEDVLNDTNFTHWLQDMIAKGVIVGAKAIH
ncbi:HvfC/BufC family peptide modification chaperone [Marinobacter nauticus]|uniref:HvfC/BufC family peptide modification chaperone n=1 Tax=Marinobacter nauticus TaxID=2743 RepID=UPI003510E5C8